jgi:excisionase family DNA binding protein
MRAATQSVRTTITVPEMAQRIGVCEPKVRALLRDGVIPNIRHGRLYIVSRYAFERWEQSIGVPPAAQESKSEE